jgi:hypothetical protein
MLVMNTVLARPLLWVCRHPMLWVMPVCRPNDVIQWFQMHKMGTPTGSASCQQYGLSACLLPLRHLPDPSLHHHL